MIRLFTTWYHDRNPARRAEYLKCLSDNLAQVEIGEVCVIAEAPLPLTASKLKVVDAAQRPTYDDFIKWINNVASPDDISIVANTDIYFDESLRLVEKFLQRNECYALARWEGNDLFDRNDSQDAWMFRGQIGAIDGSFSVGVPRCDNRFLHELRKAGYSVKNPAFAIRAHHLHAGARPEYAESASSGWVPPPYEYLWPHNLLSLPRTLVHNVTHRRDRVAWRADWRKAPLNLPRRVINRIQS